MIELISVANVIAVIALITSATVPFFLAARQKRQERNLRADQAISRWRDFEEVPSESVGAILPSQGPLKFTWSDQCLEFLSAIDYLEEVSGPDDYLHIIESIRQLRPVGEITEDKAREFMIALRKSGLMVDLIEERHAQHAQRKKDSGP